MILFLFCMWREIYKGVNRSMAYRIEKKSSFGIISLKESDTFNHRENWGKSQGFRGFFAFFFSFATNIRCNA